MSKKTNAEWDALIEEWLNQHDQTPIRKRSYLNSRQMERRMKKEIAISNLPSKLSSVIEHQLYSSQFDNED